VLPGRCSSILRNYTGLCRTLPDRIFSAPARLVTHARKKILKIPSGWTWSTDLATAWQRIHALHPA
jgi:hypothetical protein